MEISCLFTLEIAQLFSVGLWADRTVPSAANVFRISLSGSVATAPSATDSTCSADWTVCCQDNSFSRNKQN